MSHNGEKKEIRKKKINSADRKSPLHILLGQMAPEKRGKPRGGRTKRVGENEEEELINRRRESLEGKAARFKPQKDDNQLKKKCRTNRRAES